MRPPKPARPLGQKKILVYLKTRSGFLVLATSPVSTAVMWGHRPDKRHQQVTGGAK